jgi:hypothetical protein
MGDEPAYFKTIRLCSIKAALSNTIAVEINTVLRPHPVCNDCNGYAISGPGRRNGYHAREFAGSAHD